MAGRGHTRLRQRARDRADNSFLTKLTEDTIAQYPGGGPRLDRQRSKTATDPPDDIEELRAQRDSRAD